MTSATATDMSKTGVVAVFVMWDWLRLQTNANPLGVPGDFERAARVAAKIGDERTAHELGVLAEAMSKRWSVADLVRALNAEKEAA